MSEARQIALKSLSRKGPKDPNALFSGLNEGQGKHSEEKWRENDNFMMRKVGRKKSPLMTADDTLMTY